MFRPALHQQQPDQQVFSRDVAPSSSVPLLSVRSVEVEFAQSGSGNRSGRGGRNPFRRGSGGDKIRAVDDVSFDIGRGETFGLVGESGCGKSTLARAILGLVPLKSGSVFFDGHDISTLKGKEYTLEYRRSVQVVFQDPYSSLDPRQRALDSVTEPLRFQGVSKEDSQRRAREMLERVGIRPDQYFLFPHQFSGGQRQRICIARSLALSPRLLILDEPTSALDVSIQAQILILLKKLQGEFNLTYLFISHNLSVVKMMSDRVASMFMGKIVELGKREQMFAHPAHPYTQRLVSAIPEPTLEDVSVHRQHQQSALAKRGHAMEVPQDGRGEPKIQKKEGDNNRSTGETAGTHCVYSQLCPYFFDRCLSVEPHPQLIEPNHSVSCHLYPDKINEEIRTAMERVQGRLKSETADVNVKT